MFACSRSVISLAVLGMASAMVCAAPIDRLPKKNFVYDAKQIPLADVLRDFAGGVGIPIVIAEGVSGTVNANFSLTPRAFLDLVSRSFGLIWYFDGTVLHIYPSSQIQSRLFKLTGPNAAELPAKLASFGILDPRYPVSAITVNGGSLLFVSGPPRHIELIEALVDVTSSVGQEASPEIIRSFTLEHASAVDRVVQGTRLPGLATTLTGIFGKGDAGPDGAMAGIDPALAAQTKIYDQAVSAQEAAFGKPEDRARQLAEARNMAGSMARAGNDPKGTGGRSPSAIQVVAPPAAGKPKETQPVFSAHEATNTVIVRATAQQMETVAALIKQLDVPNHMVEVEATIIDISSDEVRSLGFDWRFNSNSALNQLQLSPAIPTSTTTGAIPQGTGFNITTILAAGGKELLARIRALEARGTARVVSQPKVLGAANRTAVLSDKRTASVRVAGNQDARLYSVETGTTLSVTPRVIRDAGRTRIGMDLLIEDGGFSTDTVDEVPVAQKTSISTIATLNEGQALLVGGIEVEGSSGGRSGVPYLSKLPIIGGAFKFDSAQSSRRQRLFLITPKRVQLDAASLAAAEPVPNDATAAVLPPASPAQPSSPAATASPASQGSASGSRGTPAAIPMSTLLPAASDPPTLTDPLKRLRDRYQRPSPRLDTGCASSAVPSADEC
jgi:type III secretion protein C